MRGIFICGTATRIRSFALSLLALAWLALASRADTFISAEPIPTADVIGEENLELIETLSYQKTERWANHVLEDCEVVENVIRVLRSNQAITTVNRHNTEVTVGAGGFQAITHPTFVLTIRDDGRGSVSAADVAVLNNALGYVLSQGGTVHFSPDHPDAYDFPLDYAVVTFSRRLSGAEAKSFFDFLGTIDPAL